MERNPSVHPSEMPSNLGPRICLKAKGLPSGSRDSLQLYNLGEPMAVIGLELALDVPIAAVLGERGRAVGPTSGQTLESHFSS